MASLLEKKVWHGAWNLFSRLRRLPYTTLDDDSPQGMYHTDLSSKIFF